MRFPRVSKLLVSLTLGFFCLTALADSADRGDGTPERSAGTQASESSELPGESLYQLPIVITTARGESLPLSSLRGAPLILTMFYSQCASVCPLLTMQIQRMSRRLSGAERRRVRILMVSLDSTRDTPEALRAFAAEHHITEDNWIIARASAKDVRLLAAALGIQYRELADHTFNHSAIISLADREGVVRAQTSDLADERGGFVAAVRRLLASDRPGAR